MLVNEGRFEYCVGYRDPLHMQNCEASRPCPDDCASDEVPDESALSPEWTKPRVTPQSNTDERPTTCTGGSLDSVSSKYQLVDNKSDEMFVEQSDSAPESSFGTHEC